MKIIDGNDAILGRLASFVAKNALEGEEMVVLNCEKVVITGNEKRIKEDFAEKRSKVGSGQKGPKVSRLNERIVKRAIRGMLPNHRKGRGKEALKKITCYVGIPKEYESSKKILPGRKPNVPHKNKILKVEEIFK
jgi:large subunit ribosomal protein L13